MTTHFGEMSEYDDYTIQEVVEAMLSVIKERTSPEIRNEELKFYCDLIIHKIEE